MIVRRSFIRLFECFWAISISKGLFSAEVKIGGLLEARLKEVRT